MLWCIIFMLFVSTTGTHLQVDEEWFLQPFHPFQCLPGVITGQEEGIKIAWLKTLDNHLSLKIRWNADNYMQVTWHAQNLCWLDRHWLFSLGDAEICPASASTVIPFQSLLSHTLRPFPVIRSNPKQAWKFDFSCTRPREHIFCYRVRVDILYFCLLAYTNIFNTKGQKIIVLRYYY